MVPAPVQEMGDGAGGAAAFERKTLTLLSGRRILPPPSAGPASSGSTIDKSSPASSSWATFPEHAAALVASSWQPTSARSLSEFHHSSLMNSNNSNGSGGGGGSAPTSAHKSSQSLFFNNRRTGARTHDAPHHDAGISTAAGPSSSGPYSHSLSFATTPSPRHQHHPHSAGSWVRQQPPGGVGDAGAVLPPHQYVGAGESRMSSMQAATRADAASETSFITVIPPPDFPTDSVAARRGTLVPLYPTLSGQLYAIARELSLPSIGGIALYLLDDGEGNPGPRVGERSWAGLWKRHFEEEEAQRLARQAHSHAQAMARRLNDEQRDRSESASWTRRKRATRPSDVSTHGARAQDVTASEGTAISAAMSLSMSPTHRSTTQESSTGELTDDHLTAERAQVYADADETGLSSGLSATSGPELDHTFGGPTSSFDTAPSRAPPSASGSRTQRARATTRRGTNGMPIDPVGHRPDAYASVARQSLPHHATTGRSARQRGSTTTPFHPNGEFASTDPFSPNGGPPMESGWQHDYPADPSRPPSLPHDLVPDVTRGSFETSYSPRASLFQAQADARMYHSVSGSVHSIPMLPAHTHAQVPALSSMGSTGLRLPIVARFEWTVERSRPAAAWWEGWCQRERARIAQNGGTARGSRGRWVESYDDFAQHEADGGAARSGPGQAARTGSEAADAHARSTSAMYPPPHSANPKVSSQRDTLSHPRQLAPLDNSMSQPTPRTPDVTSGSQYASAPYDSDHTPNSHPPSNTAIGSASVVAASLLAAASAGEALNRVVHHAKDSPSVETPRTEVVGPWLGDGEERDADAMVHGRARSVSAAPSAATTIVPSASSAALPSQTSPSSRETERRSFAQDVQQRQSFVFPPTPPTRSGPNASTPAQTVAQAEFGDALEQVNDELSSMAQRRLELDESHASGEGYAPLVEANALVNALPREQRSSSEVQHVQGDVDASQAVQPLQFSRRPSADPQYAAEQSADIDRELVLMQRKQAREVMRAQLEEEQAQSLRSERKSALLDLTVDSVVSPSEEARDALASVSPAQQGQVVRDGDDVPVPPSDAMEEHVDKVEAALLQMQTENSEGHGTTMPLLQAAHEVLGPPPPPAAPSSGDAFQPSLVPGGAAASAQLGTEGEDGVDVLAVQPPLPTHSFEIGDVVPFRDIEVPAAADTSLAAAVGTGHDARGEDGQGVGEDTELPYAQAPLSLEPSVADGSYIAPGRPMSESPVALEAAHPLVVAPSAEIVLGSAQPLSQHRDSGAGLSIEPEAQERITLSGWTIDQGGATRAVPSVEEPGSTVERPQREQPPPRRIIPAGAVPSPRYVAPTFSPATDTASHISPQSQHQAGDATTASLAHYEHAPNEVLAPLLETNQEAATRAPSVLGGGAESTDERTERKRDETLAALEGEEVVVDGALDAAGEVGVQGPAAAAAAGQSEAPTLLMQHVLGLFASADAGGEDAGPTSGGVVSAAGAEDEDAAEAAGVARKEVRREAAALDASEPLALPVAVQDALQESLITQAADGQAGEVEDRDEAPAALPSQVHASTSRDSAISDSMSIAATARPASIQSFQSKGSDATIQPSVRDSRLLDPIQEPSEAEGSPTPTAQTFEPRPVPPPPVPARSPAESVFEQASSNAVSATPAVPPRSAVPIDDSLAHITLDTDRPTTRAPRPYLRYEGDRLTDGVYDLYERQDAVPDQAEDVDVVEDDDSDSSGEHTPTKDDSDGDEDALVARRNAAIEARLAARNQSKGWSFRPTRKLFSFAGLKRGKSRVVEERVGHGGDAPSPHQDEEEVDEEDSSSDEDLMEEAEEEAALEARGGSESAAVERLPEQVSRSGEEDADSDSGSENSAYSREEDDPTSAMTESQAQSVPETVAPAQTTAAPGVEAGVDEVGQAQTTPAPPSRPPPPPPLALDGPRAVIQAASVDGVPSDELADSSSDTEPSSKVDSMQSEMTSLPADTSATETDGAQHAMKDETTPRLMSKGDDEGQFGARPVAVQSHFSDDDEDDDEGGEDEDDPDADEDEDNDAGADQDDDDESFFDHSAPTRRRASQVPEDAVLNDEQDATFFEPVSPVFEAGDESMIASTLGDHLPRHAVTEDSANGYVPLDDFMDERSHQASQDELPPEAPLASAVEPMFHPSTRHHSFTEIGTELGSHDDAFSLEDEARRSTALSLSSAQLHSRPLSGQARRTSAGGQPGGESSGMFVDEDNGARLFLEVPASESDHHAWTPSSATANAAPFEFDEYTEDAQALGVGVTRPDERHDGELVQDGPRSASIGHDVVIDEHQHAIDPRISIGDVPSSAPSVAEAHSPHPSQEEQGFDRRLSTDSDTRLLATQHGHGLGHGHGRDDSSATSSLVMANGGVILDGMETNWTEVLRQQAQAQQLQHGGGEGGAEASSRFSVSSHGNFESAASHLSVSS